MQNFFCPLKCQQTLMQGKACHRSSVTGTNQNLIKTNRIVSLQDQKFPLSKTQIPKCLVQMTARLQFTLSNNRLQPRAHLPASAVWWSKKGTLEDNQGQEKYSIHGPFYSPLSKEKVVSHCKKNKNTFWVFFWSTALVSSVWQSTEISEQAGQIFYPSQWTLNSH